MYKIVYDTVETGMQVIKGLTKQEMLNEVYDLYQKYEVKTLYTEKTK